MEVHIRIAKTRAGHSISTNSDTGDWANTVEQLKKHGLCDAWVKFTNVQWRRWRGAGPGAWSWSASIRTRRIITRWWWGFAWRRNRTRVPFRLGLSRVDGRSGSRFLFVRGSCSGSRCLGGVGVCAGHNERRVDVVWIFLFLSDDSRSEFEIVGLLNLVFDEFYIFFEVFYCIRDEQKEVPLVQKKLESWSVREGAGDEAKRENLGKFDFWRSDFRSLCNKAFKALTGKGLSSTHQVTWS